ncbi:MAG TPA: hypothetical protein VHT73_01510 [Thermodesulfobacteriota bacterium]|nr:hypothetical protein [Thermodesulfobacteriota bacterium]
MVKISQVSASEKLQTTTELADESLSSKVIHRTASESTIIAELVEMIYLLDKMLAKLQGSG